MNYLNFLFVCLLFVVCPLGFWRLSKKSKRERERERESYAISYMNGVEQMTAKAATQKLELLIIEDYLMLPFLHP